MRVVTINTYAGSLLQAATNLGCEVTMSLEDKNFGQGIARANFPDVSHVEKTSQWPDGVDLSETVVLAHPPCSAFSVQNVQPTARGVDSAAFACTKKVLDYSMKNKALAIAVESVMGALPGAWAFHQKAADDNGYHLYRVLQNGAMFGCQWRERFWAVFIRRGATNRAFEMTLTPRFQTVSEVIRSHEDGLSAGNQDVLLARQKARLISDAGLTDDEMNYLFKPPPHHPTKALGTVLYEYKFQRPGDSPDEKWNVFNKYVGTFTSGTMVYLDPNGLAPTLMGGSFWYTNGRCLSESAFKRIMGYPADYIFPVEKRNFRNNMRMYLSKGVMPPVAEWILEQITLHLGWYGQKRTSRSEELPAYRLSVEPNLIADFRIKKKDWYNRHLQIPPLRTDEEGIIRSIILPPRSALTSSNPSPEVRMLEPQPEQLKNTEDKSTVKVWMCQDCGKDVYNHNDEEHLYIPIEQEAVRCEIHGVVGAVHKCAAYPPLTKVFPFGERTESYPDPPPTPEVMVETLDSEKLAEKITEHLEGEKTLSETFVEPEPDPDPEPEPVPEQVELADERLTLPEDREEKTIARYVRKKNPSIKRTTPPETPKPESKPGLISRVVGWLNKTMQPVPEMIRDVPFPPTIKKPPNKIEESQSRAKTSNQSSVMDIPIAKMKAEHITVKRLRGRMLELDPKTEIDHSVEGLVQKRKMRVLEVLKRNRQISFDSLVGKCREDKHLEGLTETTLLDYVRDLVRVRQIKEVDR